MSRKPIKKYAVDLVKEFRKDTEDRLMADLPFVDLADVLQVEPEIVIEPHHTTSEYTEEYLIFAIDPDTIQLDDTLVIGRDSSHQPVVLAIADADNPDPFVNTELSAFRDNTELLRENTQHWRSSVNEESDLPGNGNTDGELRYVKGTNTLWRWDGEAKNWIPVAGAGGNFLPITGGTMTGDIIMEPGTMITLPDAPVDPSDVVNKAYVDALFALCCGDGSPLIPTITIDATDSDPCYEALLTDQTILVDTSLGPVDICLPANHPEDKFYDVKDISGQAATNNITVYSNDGDTLDGNANYIINVNYFSATFVSDGTNWYVI